MFNFKPKEEARQVPFFDDVSSKDGWEGHTTSKTTEKLVSEIATNLSLINCIFTGCQEGTYGERLGFQIHFAIKSDNGQLVPSKLDIACLPLNPKKRFYRSRGGAKSDPRIEGTKKMALYMTAKAVKGMYFLSVMSPFYIPFMSLMLDNKGTTLGQAWIQSGNMAPLLPPPDEDFEVVDGTIN